MFSILIFSCGNSEKGEKEEIRLGDYSRSPAQVKEEEDGKKTQISGYNILTNGCPPLVQSM